jgi:diguanylate cyclase (GGDEF)-like protein
LGRQLLWEDALVSRDLSLFRYGKTALRGYVYAIAGAAVMALLLALGNTHSELMHIGTGGFVFLLALNIAAEATYVNLPSGSKITASFLVLLISLYILSPAVTALIAAVGTAFSVIAQQRRHWSIAVFNASQYTIAYIFAGQVIHVFGPEPLHFTPLQLFWSAALGSLVYLSLSSLIVNGLIALRNDQNVFKLIWEEDRWEWLQVVIMWPIAVLALTMWPWAGWLGVLVPFALTLIFIDALKAFIATQVFNKHLEQMQVIVRLVSGAQETDHIWRTLCQQLPQLFPHERLDVYKVDDAKQRLKRVASDLIGAPDEDYDLLDMNGPLQRAVAHRQALNVPEIQDGLPYCDLWGGTGSLLAVPVQVGDDVQWLLALSSTTRHTFDTEHQNLLTLLASHIEVTLANVALHQSIQQQAITDALTSLYNRRYLTAKIEDELRRAMRHRRPTSLLLLDADYFKQFNDTHGHLLGDVVLRDIGRLLMEAVRETDVVARYGGEEFAVFLPETPLDRACDVAERIRLKVANYAFQGRNNQSVTLTVSIGASCSEEAALTKEELIDFADTALYRAKKQGRNQICQSQSFVGEAKSMVVGSAQEADKALPTGHRIDIRILERWAQQLKQGTETVCRQWEQAIERFPGGMERQAFDQAENQMVTEQVIDVIAERLMLITRRPEEADRGFMGHGPLFEHLRKEARRASHHPQAIMRLESNMLLFQSALQTFCSGFEGDRSLLRLLIDRLMIAIHGAVTDAWLENVGHNQLEMQSLLRALQRLNRTADPSDLPDVGASLLIETLACEGAAFTLIDGDHLVVLGRSGQGAPRHGDRLERLPVDAIRRAGTPAALTSPWPQFGGDVVAVPLVLRDQRALLLGWGPSPRHFRLEDLRLAEELATQLSATSDRMRPWDVPAIEAPGSGEPSPTP